MSIPPARPSSSRSGRHLMPGARRRRQVSMSAVAAGLIGAVGLSVAGEVGPAAAPSTAAPATANVAQAIPDQVLDAGGAVRVHAAGAAGAAAAMAPTAVSAAADAAEIQLDKLSGRESQLSEEEAQEALDTSARAAVAKPAAVPAPAAVPTIAAVAERASRQPSKSNSKAYARMAVSSHGWGDADYQCLVKLWTKESQWNHKAMNRSSGAYGIPQSLPGSKMASAGKSWRTDPPTQIRWGLSYIKSRYGAPCGAWRHSRATNWY